jgi:MFS family permease
VQIGKVMAADTSIVDTDIPARLDRLPWGHFHSLVVLALGITWVMDGLEVTLAGSLAGALKGSPILRFSNTDIGLVSSAYLVGAVLGAILFGWLADRLGRRKLFFITLSVYFVATAATAVSWNLFSFALFCFFTGAGIGDEYSAINSTIQELIPARVRVWTDLVINGSFWIGGPWGARFACGARFGADRSGIRLAALLPDWRGIGPHRLLHATMDSGKSTLADDPRPYRRSS